jgi:hypothetical protein
MLEVLSREPERALQLRFLHRLARITWSLRRMWQALDDTEAAPIRRQVLELIRRCGETEDEELRLALYQLMPRTGDRLAEGLLPLAGPLLDLYLPRYLQTTSARELEVLQVELPANLPPELAPRWVAAIERCTDPARLAFLAERLARLPDVTAAPALIDLLEGEQDPDRRQVLLQALVSRAALVDAGWVRERLAVEQDPACVDLLIEVAARGRRASLRPELRALADRGHLVTAALALAGLEPEPADLPLLRRALAAAEEPGAAARLLAGLQAVGEPTGAEVLRVVTMSAAIDGAPPASTQTDVAWAAVDTLPAAELAVTLAATPSHHLAWYLVEALGRRDLAQLPATPESRYLVVARGRAGDHDQGPRLVELMDEERSEEGRKAIHAALAACGDMTIYRQLRARQEQLPRSLRQALGRIAAWLPRQELLEVLASEPDTTILSACASLLPCRAPGIRAAAVETLLPRYVCGEGVDHAVREFLTRDRVLLARLLTAQYDPARPFAWRLRAVRLGGPALVAARQDPYPGLRPLAREEQRPLEDQVAQQGLQAARHALGSPSPVRRHAAAALLHALTGECVSYESPDGAQIRFYP